MGISNLLHTSLGKGVISIILGFGVASLFHSVCTSADCMTFRAPILTELIESIYQTYDNTCVQYDLTQTTCNDNKKTVLFHSDNDD